MNKDFTEIDGSFGEGGGQILRTALSLSCITGKPIKIFNIRKNRKKPGLMAQHLTSVKVMKTLFNADTEGDSLGSEELTFKPKEFVERDFYFDIGTAGSTSLVFQTILPVLVYFNSKIKVTLKGGTHVPMSPIFDYLKEVFSPHLEKIGIFVEFEIESYGFYPKGGGVVSMILKRVKKNKRDFDSTKRGKLMGISGKSCVANLPLTIAIRQKEALIKSLGNINCPIEMEILNVPSIGKGTYIFAKAMYENTVAGFSSLGEIGKKAELVGQEAGKALLDYHSSDGFFDEHISDQILIYLALFTRSSKIGLSKITKHFETNWWVIEKFLVPSDIIVYKDNS